MQFSWYGWYDADSGLKQYVFELFKLVPNADGELEEDEQAVDSLTIMINGEEEPEYGEFRLPAPGKTRGTQ